jgi:ABC-type multidrug transport system permease subunit
VTHAYGSRQALDDVTVSVAAGEMFALLGPNGGGKTTLFRIIATLLRPAAAVVRVFGADVAADQAFCSVLVAPVPRTTIVLGKILGSTALALMQAVVFLFISPFRFGFLGIATLAALVGILAMLAFGLSGLGSLLAWRLDSTQGFHAIMNLFLVPMWMLSGALFPASAATSWIRGLMWMNPLTYGVSALRQMIYGHRIPHEPGLAASLLVIGAFGAAVLVAGAWIVQRRPARVVNGRVP